MQLRPSQCLCKLILVRRHKDKLLIAVSNMQPVAPEIEIDFAQIPLPDLHGTRHDSQLVPRSRCACAHLPGLAEERHRSKKFLHTQSYRTIKQIR